MKTAILYTSKKGFVKEAAEHLREGMSGEAELIDLEQGKPGDLETYDTVLLASSVRAGRFPGAFRRFCRKRVPGLAGKHLFLLVSALDDAGYMEIVDRNITPGIRKQFQKVVYVGGRYLPEQYNGFIRGMMEKISKQSGAIHKENWENLDALIKDLQAL